MRILFTLILLTLTPATHADSYRCQLGPGQWVYQSQPCADGTTDAYLPTPTDDLPRSDQPTAKEINPEISRQQAEDLQKELEAAHDELLKTRREQRRSR